MRIEIIIITTKKMDIFRISACFMLLIMAAGCTGYSSGRDNGNEDYRVGTQGLTMVFLENIPPSRMYDDEEFKALIELRNVGSTDINNNARIYLSGFDPSIIMGLDSTGILVKDLEGKNIYNSEGGFDTVLFEGNLRDLESRNVDFYDTPLLVTACYGYKTIAAPSVCIDPDPYSSAKETKVCSPSSVENLKGSQGAPIAVTSVEVEPAPGKSRFKITISNVGGGTVIKDGATYLAQCSPYSMDKLEYEDVDQVRLESVVVGDLSLTGNCKPLNDQNIRLQNGQGTIWCEAENLVGSAYKTPITIQLSYNYRTTTEKTIRIVQTP